MLALIACFVATQVQIEQPPRLRTVLPNGAAVLVEKVEHSKTLSIEFLASARGTEETPSTNGLRHLLEHLVAKGPKGDIDLRLETAGGFLTAETHRSCMQFELTLPADQLKLGLRVVGELMQMPEVTTESIQREARVIEQEAAIQDNSTKLSVQAWATSFGDKGLDCMGNPDVIKNATPEMLNKLHHAQFSGANLAITVAGDVDLDSTTKACAEVLSTVPKLVLPRMDVPKGHGGSVNSTANGEVLAVPVVGWRSPSTAARVAAAFALASELDGCFVIYTPSAGPGLVLVGRSSTNQGLQATAERSKPDELFVRGRSIAKAWIQRMLSSPQRIAESRGELLVQEVDLKPETLIENLDTMTPKDFAAAFAAFHSPETVSVVGK